MTDFATATERLINQVKHWEQPRWSAPAGRGSRADEMYALIQHLADLAADAEGQPHRPVPREHDLILPDQLQVMADDLIAAAPPASLDLARAAVEELRTKL